MFSFFLLTVNWTHLVFVASSKGISVSTLEHGSGAESSQMELVLRRVWALGSHSRGVARHFHHPRHPHYQHHVLCCCCHLNCPHPIVKRLPWCGLMIWSLRDERLDSDVTGGEMGSLMLGLSACRRQGSWRMCGCFHHACSTYTSLCFVSKTTKQHVKFGFFQGSVVFCFYLVDYVSVYHVFLTTSCLCLLWLIIPVYLSLTLSWFVCF